MYVLSVWAARRGCAALLTRCRPPAALCAARTKDFITPVWTFAGEHFVAA